jgi:signal peptidase II
MLKIVIAALIIALDQLTKLWIIHNFNYQDNFSVTSFFKLVHFQNTGAAFSFLHDASGWQNIFFVTLSILILIYLFYLYKKLKDVFPAWLSLLLIMAGAVGNLIDRIRIGHVTDFIYLHYNDFYWPAFNVADSAICLGALLYLYSLGKGQIK